MRRSSGGSSDLALMPPVLGQRHPARGSDTGAAQGLQALAVRSQGKGGVCSACGAPLNTRGSRLATSDRGDAVPSHRLFYRGSGSLRKEGRRLQLSESGHWQVFGWNVLAALWYLAAMMCVMLAVVWLTWQDWLH
jgi:hypothetical protein